MIWLNIKKATYVCRNNLMHLFEILCECVVYNYKSKLESNISTDLIDINANLRPLMEIGKPANHLNQTELTKQ